MPRSLSHGSGLIFLPLAFHTSKCRWVPVEKPRLPMVAIWSPALTWSPSSAVMLLTCP